MNQTGATKREAFQSDGQRRQRRSSIPHGSRVGALPLMEEGVLRGVVFAREGTTFFTRIGWRFPEVILVLWLATCLWLLAKQFRGWRAGRVRDGADRGMGVLGERVIACISECRISKCRTK